MAKFDLQANESVVQRAENVMHGDGFLSSYTDELVLTNVHLIWISKGPFKNVKRIQYFPLNHVKVHDDRAQALLVTRMGAGPQLEVFFHESHEIFQFGPGKKREVAKWADAINELVTGCSPEAHKSAIMALPGTEAIAETLRDTFSQFRSSFGDGKMEPPTRTARVTTKCSSCGAQVSGLSGAITRCEYCDSACSMP